MIVDLLTLLTTTKTAVGGRVYANLAPHNAARPLVVFTEVSTIGLRTLDPSTGPYQTVMQFDVYADTYAATETVSAALETDIGDYIGEVGDTDFQGISFESKQDLPDRDDDGGDRVIYRKSIEYRIRWGNAA